MDLCRARANECMEAADRISDMADKVALLELAERWFLLAAEIGGIEELRRTAKDTLTDARGPSRLKH